MFVDKVNKVLNRRIKEVVMITQEAIRVAVELLEIREEEREVYLLNSFLEEYENTNGFIPSC